MKKFALFFVLLMLFACLTGCTEETAVESGSAEETYTPAESTPLPGEVEGIYDADHCSQDSHSFITEIMTEVGCETYGEVQHTCAYCGWYYFELVMATGHDYNPPTCEFDAYCTICHNIVETATGHTTSDGICGNCGKYVQE